MSLRDYPQWPGASPVGRVGTFGPGAANKIAVEDPSNPGTLIWVEARQDTNGDLVPVDPRYDIRAGSSRNLDGTVTSLSNGEPVGGSSTVLIACVAIVAILLFTRS